MIIEGEEMVQEGQELLKEVVVDDETAHKKRVHDDIEAKNQWFVGIRKR
jgi:hypothetical protein